MSSADSSSRGLTVTEFAQRYRVGEDKVRGWIRRGELIAINTATHECRRPRWVIPPEAIDLFEKSRSAPSPKKQIRKQKSTREVDYYP